MPGCSFCWMAGRSHGDISASARWNSAGKWGRLAEAMAQHTHPAANRTPELYLQVRDAWEPIEGPKLVIDTDADLDSCVDRALRYLTGRSGDGAGLAH
jgi:hypothetical protein